MLGDVYSCDVSYLLKKAARTVTLLSVWKRHRKEQNFETEQRRSERTTKSKMMSLAQSELAQSANESVLGKGQMRPVLVRLNTGDVDKRAPRGVRAVRFNPDRGENAPSSSESDIDSSLEDADYPPPIVERRASLASLEGRKRGGKACKTGKMEAAVRRGGKGRRKVKIELVKNKSRRYATFSKRKIGIMKKVHELAMLTGTQVLLMVVSETGYVYTNATHKLQPMLTGTEGKALIQKCLSSPDPPSHYDPSTDKRMSSKGFEETDLTFQVSESPVGQTEAASQLDTSCNATASTTMQLSSGQSFPIANFAELPRGFAPAMYNGYSGSPWIQPSDSSSTFTELQVANTAQTVCNRPFSSEVPPPLPSLPEYSLRWPPNPWGIKTIDFCPPKNADY